LYLDNLYNTESVSEFMSSLSRPLVLSVKRSVSIKYINLIIKKFLMFSSLRGTLKSRQRVLAPNKPTSLLTNLFTYPTVGFSPNSQKVTRPHALS
jgi:hypothetical protein